MIDACRLLSKINELTLRDHSINYYYRLVEVVHSRLAYIFKHSGGKELKEHLREHFAARILNLAEISEDEALIEGSIQLLDKHFSSELNIFHRAGRSQLLITEESTELHREIINRRHLLKQYLNPKVNLHSQASQSSMSNHEKDSEPFLKKLTRKCWLEEEVEGYEPCRENQRMIYKFGTCKRNFVHNQLKYYSKLAAVCVLK